jgi:hypothetical protein
LKFGGKLSSQLNEPTPPEYTTFYKILAPFGLTIDSTMAQIRDTGFDLMEQPEGMTQAQRLAWDTLRKVETRLVADFLSWHLKE